MKKVLTAILVILIILLLGGGGAYFFLKKRYPLKYEELVSRYSSKYDLEESFVLGVIWAESRFNPKATSGVGARGLMQIMPDTGEWISKKIDLKDYNHDMLYDPEINIEMGCWYFSYLKTKFDGDELKMLAGYNAGPGNVEKWVKGDEFTSDHILFPMTKKYVKSVEDARKIYRLLYNIS